MSPNAQLRKDPAAAAAGGVGFACGPLPPGLLVPLGGALRRVLLSCLPAPAIVSAQIARAPHPFATVAGVSPDVPTLLNRLAQVCFTGRVTAAARVDLGVRGPAVVCAGGLRCPEGLAVANPELPLAEVSSGATLALVATVEGGIGRAPRLRQTAEGGFAVAGSQRPVQSVRMEQRGEDLLLRITAADGAAESHLRDAAALLRAHLQIALASGTVDDCLGELSFATRRQWGATLSSITYSYEAASRRIELSGVEPHLAGAVGELLVAALAAPGPQPPLFARSSVLCPPAGEPVLQLICEPGERNTDCLEAVRQAADRLCGLLAAMCREPVAEPVAFGPTPPAARRRVTGRIELERPDLAFVPEDPLSVPQRCFSRLVGHSEGSLEELVGAFFPLQPDDCPWRLELRQVRIPAPESAPQECLATGEGYGGPILLRLALLGPGGELVQEREASAGLLPWMTPEGTFILPGGSTELVVANELAPAPGAIAYRLENRAFATLAPQHGPALTFSSSESRGCQVCIGNGRSMNVGVLLLALGADGAEAPVILGLDAADCRRQVGGWLEAVGGPSRSQAQEVVATCLDAPAMEGSAAAFNAALTDPRAWSLGDLGRRRLEQRLGVPTAGAPALAWQDVAAVALLLEAVAGGVLPADDPVALSTHILRTPGRQIAEVVRQALVTQIPAIAQRLQAAGSRPPEIGDLMADLTPGAAIGAFFSGSPLVSPVEATNRLARIEHCRRVVFGVGRRLGHEADGPLCRQFPRDAPGRLCMIETPEGPNVGLIAHLALGAALDDDGFVLAPLRPVRDGEVAAEIVWLHPEAELAANVCDPLPPGTPLATLGDEIVCRRNGLLSRCRPDAVDYCEAGHGSNVGLSAGLIPASAHSDSARLLMGANMQRQAVALLSPQSPLVSTGLADDRPQPPAPGHNLLVAYMPWLGHNFEDAIVLSEEVVGAGALSSVHRRRLTVTLRHDETTTATPDGLASDRLHALAQDGVARPGAAVSPGDVLVGVGELGRDRDLVRQVAGEGGEGRSLLVPPHVWGTVAAVARRPEGRGRLQSIEVEVLSERPPAPGDKLANRHGGKGVVGRIVPVEQMPFLPDGTPVEMLINPLGVPSRLNLGQLYETSLGWVANALGSCVVLPPGAAVDRRRLAELLRRAGLPETGKVHLRDGRTGRLFGEPALVGFLFLHKLDHLAQDKVHARSTGPYSAVTQQPVGGRARSGGQRFGEMETWALEAYGAAHTLREMLTIKSDDVRGRERAFAALLAKEAPAPVDAPESLALLIEELRALGLAVELKP